MSDPGQASDPRAYLSSLELHGIKLGLSTIRAICAAMGHPERAFRTVLIAGTNGKGSVAAMTAAALRAAGHRTARYTSPHLVRLEERFEVDGEPVRPAALDEAIDTVRAAVVRLQDEGVIDIQPTFFELTTAAGFELFRRAGTSIAVLEVGLGGRFDATNVVDPAAVAITSIAFDHEAYLGSTLEAIAFEKAGVLRRVVPAILGALPDAARAVVESAACDRGARLVDAWQGCAAETSAIGGLTALRLSTPGCTYPPLMLALRGDHQVGNAVVAVRLLEALDAAGVPVPAGSIVAGLEAARWPARLDLQTWPDGRQLLVDGAHNPAGAEALARYVAREWPGGLPLVFGAMRDKSLARMLAALAPVARPFVLTEAPGRRAATITDLRAAAAEAGLPAPLAEPDPRAAVERAWDIGPTAVVAGSLYLAGHVLAALGRI